MLKASHKNILVKHPAYAKILFQYNELLQKEGKVNNKKFFDEIVSPEIPGYKMQSWYMFLKRFKTNAGIIAVNPETTTPDFMPAAEGITNELTHTLMTNQEATAKLIAGILNISASAAMEVIKDPTKLTTKERIELGIKGMKAQDSRIHAVGKLREDNREQERFDRAFDAASYGGE